MYNFLKLGFFFILVKESLELLTIRQGKCRTVWCLSRESVVICKISTANYTKKAGKAIIRFHVTELHMQKCFSDTCVAPCCMMYKATRSRTFTIVSLCKALSKLNE